MQNRDELKHYGMPRRSGRYPFGSGKDPDPSSPRGLRKIGQKINDAYENRANKIIDRASNVDPTSQRGFFKRIADSNVVKTASDITRDRKTNNQGFNAEKINALAKKWNAMTPGQRLKSISIGKEAAVEFMSIWGGATMFSTFLGPFAMPLGASTGKAVYDKGFEDQFKNKIDYGKKFVNEFAKKAKKP